MDIIKKYNILNLDDILMLENTDPDTKYRCSCITKCKGFTLLMRLVLLTYNYPDLCDAIEEYIILYPEEVNKVNDINWSPLIIAARNIGKFSNVNVIKLLLKYGANVECKTNYLVTSLMFLSQRSQSIKPLQLLLEYDATANIADYGTTSINYYIEKNNLEKTFVKPLNSINLLNKKN